MPFISTVPYTRHWCELPALKRDGQWRFTTGTVWECGKCQLQYEINLKLGSSGGLAGAIPEWVHLPPKSEPYEGYIPERLDI